MSCLCAKIKSIPQCTEQLVVGGLPEAGNVYVFIHNKTLDTTVRIEAVVDESLNLIIDLTGIALSPVFSYEFHVTEQSEQPFENLIFTINSVEYNCLSFDVYRIDDTSGNSIIYPTVTAELL